LPQLSAAQREVVDLVYYHEKTVDEVAQIVGAPASTVKTRLFAKEWGSFSRLRVSAASRPAFIACISVAKAAKQSHDGKAPAE
jgi:hypothetical protein